MLGLRKSNRDACQAKKAMGLFFATLFLLTQVNISPAQAKLSEDLLEPIHILECASDDASNATLESQRAPQCKFSRQSAAKPQSENGLCAGSAISPSCERFAQRLVYFYAASKFATFDIKLRKSRDPPAITSLLAGEYRKRSAPTFNQQPSSFVSLQNETSPDL